MQGIRPISATEIVEHNFRYPAYLTAFASVVSVPLSMGRNSVRKEEGGKFGTKFET